ncbi:MAG: AMP-binding protein [Pacificimonas sp.]
METFSFGKIAARLSEAVDLDKPAILQGDHVLSWRDFDARTDALAAAFAEGGAVPGDKVAHLMRNSAAYLETTWAAFKARLVHVNVNYRYTGEELFYILDNSDSAVVVHDPEFTPLIEELKTRLTKVKLFLEVGSSFEDAATSGKPAPPAEHAPDDMLFIYTGGTTGHPKGVMWDQGDIWQLMGAGASGTPGDTPTPTMDDLLEKVRTGEMRRLMVLPPLMHGSGYLVGIYTLALGGSVVLVEGKSFDSAETIRSVGRHRPNWAVIVGDAFARPILKTLDEDGGDISPLQIIISSGTMWSPEVKAGLLRHNPDMLLLDALGSSESLGMGMSITAKDNVGAPTKFEHDPNTIVVDEDMKPISAGDPREGRIARGGLIPRGYYADEAKSAATFLEIDGQRYSLAGDHARVEADGTITLLGRGNQCINTGGEKVFPEEVEESLKTHPAIDDALVFGVADEKWGQAVTAVAHAAKPVDPHDLIAHVKSHLAAYKAPKHIYLVDEVPRAPNGKADYARAREMFARG